MQIPRIQSASRIYRPTVKTASEATKKTLQQISLLGMTTMMISESVKANSIKCGSGSGSCSDGGVYSVSSPDLYSC